MTSGVTICLADKGPPIWRDPAAWATMSDVFAVLIATALPWSTSLVAVFVVAWLVSVVPTLDANLFIQSLKRPICALPIAFFLLAVIGTLWSDALWAVRLHAVSPTAKLLVLPALIYHFERSARGAWVLGAFLVSCALMMVMSWVVVFDSDLTLKAPAHFERGIFLKNHIDQSQEFVLCVVALAYPIRVLIGEKRFALATLLVALALSFIINMAFATVSRTVLVTIPILLAFFALAHLSRRHMIVAFCGTAALVGVVWLTSARLRATGASLLSDYRIYEEHGSVSSVGLRLEFWRKSLQFFYDAPVFGHGTGSTRGLFAKAAIGQFGAAAVGTDNPHNQTLNVAVQWGVAGIAVLYAMWLSHLLLFRGHGLVNWIGLLVVLQNMISSLFHSHLFDFDEGWMYVLGVGLAAGMRLRAAANEAK